MSDERANQPIAMRAPRNVDMTEWLFVASNDVDGSLRGHETALNPKFWGRINLRSDWGERMCGAIFVAEVNNSISRPAAQILEYFFTRDGDETVVFEFDKFEGDFKLRRWDQILARTR